MSEEMTREEAIKHIKAMCQMLLGADNKPISDTYYALEMAISALSAEQRTGHWILVSDKTPGGYWKCSECLMHKRMPSGRLDSFCLCCGADMREDSDV